MSHQYSSLPSIFSALGSIILASGYVKIATVLNMAMDIVEFPIDSMVIFHSYVSLPEGSNLPHHRIVNPLAPALL